MDYVHPRKDALLRLDQLELSSAQPVIRLKTTKSTAPIIASALQHTTLIPMETVLVSVEIPFSLLMKPVTMETPSTEMDAAAPAKLKHTIPVQTQ